MYRIRFSPYVTKIIPACPELACTRVYSEHLEHIQMFLKQHNFDPSRSYIENISPEEAEQDDLDDRTLRKYFMGSNIDHCVHEIYTTPDLVQHANLKTSIKLGDHLLLGECILRRDIQLIHLIADVIEEIPYAEILDYQALDDKSVDDPYDTSWMIVSKSIEQILDNPSSTPTSDNICDEIERRTMPENLLPITLEAYVEAFVAIIMK